MFTRIRFYEAVFFARDFGTFVAFDSVVEVNGFLVERVNFPTAT